MKKKEGEKAKIFINRVRHVRRFLVKILAKKMCYTGG